jgi:Terminase large subunit, T4likevirus-type, N-terminal
MAPTIEIGRALAHAIDPCLWARDTFGFRPEDWQRRVLSSTARRMALRCGRQTGKSTTISLLACHTAIFADDEALVMLAAKNQKQSIEFSRKVTGWLQKIEPVEELVEDNKTSLTLARNRSRIISLPGHNPDEIRGYSSPRLIIIDEAAFAMDAIYHNALRPMLIRSPEGRLVLLSSPNLQTGFFYEACTNWPDWERYHVPSTDSPYISKAELAAAERENPLTFKREYLAEFSSGEDSLFGDLDRLVSYDFEPFLT